MDKWEVVRIYCDFLPTPHDKFCICICPATHLYFFINSNPPQFRKARTLAVSIENFEANFLTHLSYVDTTSLEQIRPELALSAYEEIGRRHGQIAPFLRRRIQEMVETHEALTADQKALVLTD